MSKRAKRYDRYEKRVVKLIQPSIINYLNKQGKRIAKHIRNYKDTKSDETDDILNSYDFDRDKEELSKEIKKNMYTVADLSHELAYIELYGSIRHDDIPAIVNNRYTDFIEEYALNQASEITDTTKKRTRRVIKHGLEKGKSYSQIADDIIDKTDIESVARARTIVTTEAHTSFMTARDLNAEIGGFKEKLWLTAGDRSVRSQHQEYESLGYVPMDYLYGGRMLYPGAPNGFAWDVINCRCDIVYR